MAIWLIPSLSIGQNLLQRGFFICLRRIFFIKLLDFWFTSNRKPIRDGIQGILKGNLLIINIQKFRIMNKKMFYEAPDAELIELKLENNQMDAGSPGGAGGDDEIVDGGDLG